MAPPGSFEDELGIRQTANASLPLLATRCLLAAASHIAWLTSSKREKIYYWIDSATVLLKYSRLKDKFGEAAAKTIALHNVASQFSDASYRTSLRSIRFDSLPASQLLPPTEQRRQIRSRLQYTQYYITTKQALLLKANRKADTHY